MIGKRLNEIIGYENLIVYIKFTSHKYLDDILNGNIHMNNFKYFIDLEKETKIKGQGDKYEVAHIVKSTDIKLIDPKTKRVIATSKSGDLVERYKHMEKLPLFCVMGIKSQDMIIASQSDGKNYVKINISLEEQKLIKENFGQVAIILKKQFLDSLQKYSDRENLGIIAGDVQYQDYDYFSSERKKQFDDFSIDILFWKDKYFKYQREVRFILTNRLVDDYYRFNIGDIREKTIVTSCDNLFNEYLFELDII